MRLVDADALKDSIKKTFGVYLDGTYNNRRICDLIDNAPTIIYCNQTSDGLPLFDLRERPRGEWIYHKGDGYFLPKMECSQCHESDLLGDLTPKLYKDYYKFCFRCGADMRKGGEL